MTGYSQCDKLLWRWWRVIRSITLDERKPTKVEISIDTTGSSTGTYNIKVDDGSTPANADFSLGLVEGT